MKTIISLIVVVMLFTGCNSHENSPGENNTSVTYYCPMHPEVVSDKAGVCPICQMDLVKKVDEGNAVHYDDFLKISPQAEFAANIKTLRVTEREIVSVIKGYSYIEIPEENRKFISAKFNGRIEKLHKARSGVFVTAGELLFEAYSPELSRAQSELIIAAGEKNSSGIPQVYQSAVQKLLLYGLTKEQISEIETEKQVKNVIKIYSPYNGIILSKKAVEGGYFNEGTQLYEIADLSRVRCVTEIYGENSRNISVGQKVRLTLTPYPGEVFEGKVDLILPLVNPENRTVKVYSDFSNDRMKLKPNMYGEAVFTMPGKKGILVPADAVIVTGTGSIVWKKTGEREYTPLNVVAGVRTPENEYEILSGLSIGDEIVVNGSYLLDSEMQLRGGSKPNGNNTNNTSQVKPANEKQQQIIVHPPENGVTTWNSVCPIQGDEVSDKAPTVTYKGRRIGFCCKGCDKDFIKDPEKHLRNLSADGKQFIGDKP